MGRGRGAASRFRPLPMLCMTCWGLLKDRAGPLSTHIPPSMLPPCDAGAALWALRYAANAVLH